MPLALYCPIASHAAPAGAGIGLSLRCESRDFRVALLPAESHDHRYCHTFDACIARGICDNLQLNRLDDRFYGRCRWSISITSQRLNLDWGAAIPLATSRGSPLRFLQ
jgi:hypothetical protein